MARWLAVIPWLATAMGIGEVSFAASPPVNPNGASMLRVLGANAEGAVAPTSGQVSALVRVPSGQKASQLGLEEFVPGIARLAGGPRAIVSFAEGHPEARVEVGPVLHPLMSAASNVIRASLARNSRGLDGKGALVGVADTGLDLAHEELRDAEGNTRVQWLLDLSMPPRGKYAELEEKYGIHDDKGKLILGAVYDAYDIDTLLSQGSATPYDEVGHGTHVTSLAAGSGLRRDLRTGEYVESEYRGVAPGAGIVFARVTRTGTDAIENDDLLRGVKFMFDRADFMRRPMVVNLSVGTDFGPHDGTTLWEQTLANFVGPEHPGRAMVVAAGNSGSISESAVHQNVYVAPKYRMWVPIITNGARSGGVQIWITKGKGADLKVGLEGTDGEWIPPVAEGQERGKNTSSYNAGVIHGSGAKDSPIPKDSNGAVVLWQGNWPKGTYFVTLEGQGAADLYLQVLGDAARAGVGFANGVREGTINLPGTHPGIIAVGCSVNRAVWQSISGTKINLRSPLLDPWGALPQRSTQGRVLDGTIESGDLCWFSSAGPTASGVPKPEIVAPGAGIVGAMSSKAKPGQRVSIFSPSSCPPSAGGPTDTRCLQVDDTHGVAVGTSMSAPLVSGTIALLFQKDPSLTQDKIVSLLQAGAHPLRRPTSYFDQGGVGELDVEGALDAHDSMTNSEGRLPSRQTSWLVPGATYAVADGSKPLVVIVELRTEDGQRRADNFDPSRLAARVVYGDSNMPLTPNLVRKGPGLWFYTVQVPPGNGGSTVTLGATFDGVAIVDDKTIPIATDRWTAVFPSSALGSGCAVVRGRPAEPSEPIRRRLGAAALMVAAVGARAYRRRRTVTGRRG